MYVGGKDDGTVWGDSMFVCMYCCTTRKVVTYVHRIGEDGRGEIFVYGEIEL